MDTVLKEPALLFPKYWLQIQFLHGESDSEFSRRSESDPDPFNLNPDKLGCFILDGCSFHYAHIRISHFDLFKAYGYIERFVKSKKNRKRPGKDQFYIKRSQHVLSYHLI